MSKLDFDTFWEIAETEIAEIAEIAASAAANPLNLKKKKRKKEKVESLLISRETRCDHVKMRTSLTQNKGIEATTRTTCFIVF